MIYIVLKNLNSILTLQKEVSIKSYKTRVQFKSVTIYDKYRTLKMKIVPRPWTRISSCRVDDWQIPSSRNHQFHVTRNDANTKHDSTIAR